jgi:2-polyprenyl-6-methoxyphenol hydroxylase-like FAD-dependent oxidoreductase
MKGRHVVVMGAGFGGAFVAHRLSSIGYRVAVVDPMLGRRLASIRQPLSPIHSTPGVPQSAHLHVLLRSGFDILAKSYPGLIPFLDTQLSPAVDWGENTVWQGPFGRAPVHKTGVLTRSFSRPMIDHFMLNSLLKDGCVSLVDSAVKSVEFENGAVTGVHTSCNRFFASDLAIDCRGKSSNISNVIKTTNLSQEKYRSDRAMPVIYRTKLLRSSGSSKQYYQQAWPPFEHDGAVLTHLENGFSILTLIHYGRTKLSQLNFETAVLELGNHEISSLFRNATVESDERVYYFKSCVRKIFSNSTSIPDGLIVLGDALVQFNPVFGQGMTVTAQAVDVVAKGLRRGHRTRQIQRDIERKTLLPWLMSSQSPGTLQHRILGLVLKQSFSSESKHRRFLRVQHLLEHPASLLMPRWRSNA